MGQMKNSPSMMTLTFVEELAISEPRDQTTHQDGRNETPTTPTNNNREHGNVGEHTTTKTNTTNSSEVGENEMTKVRLREMRRKKAYWGLKLLKGRKGNQIFKSDPSFSVKLMVSKYRDTIAKAFIRNAIAIFFLFCLFFSISIASTLHSSP
ncbi:hypothetical protein V8G54_036150 [Vigna mungo]|uniref:Transmembrane protein n=1 Tax=Vigna mungo TaxID=3915 RepID=A0AAQ3MGR8_VIGMU